MNDHQAGDDGEEMEEDWETLGKLGLHFERGLKKKKKEVHETMKKTVCCCEHWHDVLSGVRDLKRSHITIT